VWVRVEAGNKAGDLRLFLFRTISKGLLRSSEDSARRMLQVCRRGRGSSAQPGVPALALTLGHSLWLRSLAQVDGNASIIHALQS